MKLNIRQIEIFAAVMEYGSTVAAADNLHVSQPSVSKHLKLFESNSGVSLFIRNNNRLIPTPEALALFEEIKRTYKGLSHIENTIKNLSGSVKHQFGIGSMPMLSYKWLPKIVTDFLDDFDHYSVSVPVATHQTIGTWVASGRVDLGICMAIGHDLGVNQELLMQLPLVCVFPADHDKAKQSIITSSDLHDETLITLQSVDDWKSDHEGWSLAIQNKLDKDKVRPKNSISVSTSQHACEFTSLGLGIALVDALTAIEFQEKGLKWVPFDFNHTFDIYLITPKGAHHSQLVSKFLNKLRTEAKVLNQEINNRIPSFR